MSLKGSIYKTLSQRLLDEVKALQYVERYYKQFENEGKQFGITDNSIFIDFPNTDFERRENEWKQNKKPSIVQCVVYINSINVAQSFRTLRRNAPFPTGLQNDSPNFEASLADWEFEQAVWQAINEFTDTCGGIQKIKILSSEEFLQDTQLFVKRLNLEIWACEWNFKC